MSRVMDKSDNGSSSISESSFDSAGKADATPADELRYSSDTNCAKFDASGETADMAKRLLSRDEEKESQESTKKRSAPDDEHLFSNPIVDEIFKSQLVQMDELDDIPDLNTTPICLVSNKRQKTPDGYYQKIESAYAEAVKTVGDKTVSKDSTAYIEYNNSFDPRMYFQGMIPSSYYEHSLDEGVVKTSNTNFLLHVRNGPDLYEQYMARYQIYLAGLSKTPTINMKSRKSKQSPSRFEKEPVPLLKGMMDWDNPKEQLDESGGEIKLLWNVGKSKSPRAKLISPSPPGPVRRPFKPSWRSYKSQNSNSSPTKLMSFCDMEHSPDKRGALNEPPTAPATRPLVAWSPSLNGSEEESDSPQHYPPALRTGINVEQLLASYGKKEKGTSPASFFSSAADKAGRRRLWDDNDLMMTWKNTDEFQLSPNNMGNIKRSHSDPDIQRQLLLAKDDDCNIELQTKVSDKGLNPMVSEFIPSGHGSSLNRSDFLPFPNSSFDDSSFLDNNSFEVRTKDFPSITRATSTPENGTQTKPDFWRLTPKKDDGKPLWIGGPGTKEDTATVSKNKEDSQSKKTLTYAQIAKPPPGSQGNPANRLSPENNENKDPNQSEGEKDVGVDSAESMNNSPETENSCQKKQELYMGEVDKVKSEKKNTIERATVTSKHTSIANPAFVVKEASGSAMYSQAKLKLNQPPQGVPLTYETATLANSNKQGMMANSSIGGHLNQVGPHIQAFQQRNIQHMNMMQESMGKCNQPPLPVTMIQGQHHMMPFNCFPMEQHMFPVSHQANIPPATINQLFHLQNQPHVQNPMMAPVQSHVMGQNTLINPQMMPPRRAFPGMNAQPFQHGGMKLPQENFHGVPPQGYAMLPPHHIPIHIQAPHGPGMGMSNPQPPPSQLAPPPPKMRSRPLIDQSMKKIEVNQLMNEILAASQGNGKKPTTSMPRPPGNTNSNCSAGINPSVSGDVNPWRELASLTERFKTGHANM